MYNKILSIKELNETIKKEEFNNIIFSREEFINNKYLRKKTKIKQNEYENKKRYINKNNEEMKEEIKKKLINENNNLQEQNKELIRKKDDEIKEKNKNGIKELKNNKEIGKEINEEIKLIKIIIMKMKN